MTPDQPDASSEAQSRKTITDRITDLEPGDVVYVNNRSGAYEVIDTDTYSVVVTDEHGTEVTFAQNLQTGGWTINEEIHRVELEDEDM